MKLNSSYLPDCIDTQSCTGCSACANICSHFAITMVESQEGFLFPKIDKDKCVQCGLCEKRCPVNVEGHCSNVYDNQEYYLTTNVNDTDSYECATIGLCTMIAKKAFEEGWAVFGVILDEKEWKSYHIKAENVRDIDAFRNSKYVQSNPLESFREAKKELRRGKKVLYIGTPCQIAGIKSYLGKLSDNLYTIDLICHGIFSYKLLQKEISYWEGVFHGKVSHFRFRSKYKYPWIEGGMVNFDIETKGTLKHQEIFAAASPSYRCFAYSGDGINYSLRESCYTCPFRDESRYGDLTVGDAWIKIKKYPKLFNKRNNRTGISSVYCNSPKAAILLNMVESSIRKHNFAKEDAFYPAAMKPSIRQIPSLRYEIYDSIEQEDIGHLVERLLHCNLQKARKSLVKDYYIRKIKEIVKKL